MTKVAPLPLKENQMRRGTKTLMKALKFRRRHPKAIHDRRWMVVKIKRARAKFGSAVVRDFYKRLGTQ